LETGSAGNEGAGSFDQKEVDSEIDHGEHIDLGKSIFQIFCREIAALFNLMRMIAAFGF
jgi:hypothetical protein